MTPRASQGWRRAAACLHGPAAAGPWHPARSGLAGARGRGHILLHMSGRGGYHAPHGSAGESGGMIVSGLGPKDSREPDVRCARVIGRRGVVLGAAAVLAVGFPARGEDAAREFEILFGREVKRVQRTPGTRDDAELAGRVLAAAGKAKAGSALRVLLYERAYELGVRHLAGHETAAKAIRLLGGQYPAREAECEEKLLKVLQMQYTAARGADFDTVIIESPLK